MSRFLHAFAFASIWSLCLGSNTFTQFQYLKLTPCEGRQYEKLRGENVKYFRAGTPMGELYISSLSTTRRGLFGLSVPSQRVEVSNGLFDSYEIVLNECQVVKFLGAVFKPSVQDEDPMEQHIQRGNTNDIAHVRFSYPCYLDGTGKKNIEMTPLTPTQVDMISHQCAPLRDGYFRKASCRNGKPTFALYSDEKCTQKLSEQQREHGKCYDVKKRGYPAAEKFICGSLNI